MDKRIVTIEIDEQGNSTVDLTGFEGRGCADVAKAFQCADTVVEERTKREFYSQMGVRQCASIKS